jgi:hypothetical protein
MVLWPVARDSVVVAAYRGAIGKAKLESKERPKPDPTRQHCCTSRR